MLICPRRTPVFCQRIFKKTSGLTSKVYVQLIRLKYIAMQMTVNKQVKQLNLIYKHDLTDHSHLRKITKSFSKETPENLKSKISRFFTKAYFIDDIDIKIIKYEKCTCCNCFFAWNDYHKLWSISKRDYKKNG